METNRGCPFKCTYCFWGGAIGAKVFKYDDERLKREIEWISRAQAWYLYFADANWGMLPRDVELSRFIVDCTRRNGAPIAVHFCGSKNTPDRVAAISRIFHEGGILASCSVALQTMSATVLKEVERDNIKTSAYVQLQQVLNELGMSSYVEMIWPLPGETLSSFQEGLATLCTLGADSFSVYNLLLMNNVAMAARKEELGLVAIRDPNPNSEAEIVVQTKDVSRETFDEGMRYYYGVHCLYTLRGLKCVARYLHETGRREYLQLFRDFKAFCWRKPLQPWAQFCDSIIRSFDAETFGNTGPLTHAALHADRERFDDLLERFLAAQDFWADPIVRLLFEVDLINRPYVYRNTPIVEKQHVFTMLSPRVTEGGGYIVDIPAGYTEELRRYAGVTSEGPGPHRFVVTHRRTQMSFSDRKSLDEHYVYCFERSQRMRDLLPEWCVEAPAATDARVFIGV
jgi:hypothetical protein